VDIAKTGQGASVRSIQEVLENSYPGQDVGALAYAVSLTRGNKEAMTLLRMASEKQGVLSGSLTQVMLNTMIATMGVPLWNAGAMLTMEALMIKEAARAARIAGSQTVKGEAGAELYGFVNSYMQLLRGNHVMKQRIGEDFANIKKLFPVFDASTDVGRFGEKLQIRKSISAKNWNATGFFGQAVDAMGSVVNIPTGMTASMDAFLRFAVRTGAMEAAALRQATRDVQHSISTSGQAFSRQQLNTRINELRSKFMENPDNTFIDLGDGVSKSLTQIGLEKADYISLMKKATGKAGAARS
jgi:hypothetical protein